MIFGKPHHLSGGRACKRCQTVPMQGSLVVEHRVCPRGQGRSRPGLFLGTQGFVHRFQVPGMNRDNDGFAGRYIFFSDIYLYQIYEKSINSQCSFHRSAPIILSSRCCRFREFPGRLEVPNRQLGVLLAVTSP